MAMVQRNIWHSNAQLRSAKSGERDPFCATNVISWLVGGLEHLSIYWEFHHPNWLIFFRWLKPPTFHDLLDCFPIISWIVVKHPKKPLKSPEKSPFWPLKSTVRLRDPPCSNVFLRFSYMFHHFSIFSYIFHHFPSVFHGFSVGSTATFSPQGTTTGWAKPRGTWRRFCGWVSAPARCPSECCRRRTCSTRRCALMLSSSLF